MKIRAIFMSAKTDAPIQPPRRLGLRFGKKITLNAIALLTGMSTTFAPIAWPSDAAAQVRARTATSTAFVCSGNRFTNGDFAQMAPGRTPDARGDQDIDAAVGWQPLWQGGSLADLYSQGQAGTGSAPTPANGNYASMWITNRNIADDVGYREGMYNQLVTPIAANTGMYTFTFKTAPLNAGTSGTTYVGVYGVKRPSSAALPFAPTGVNTPSNLTHFGAGTTVLLGSVAIPASDTNAWALRTMTFDSSSFGGLSNITHVMVTKLDNAPQQTQVRYVAFDDFCMQTTADHTSDTNGGSTGGGNTGGGSTGGPSGPPVPTGTTCPGTGCTDADFSTCCPPTATFNLGSLFEVKQPNLTGDFYVNFRGLGSLDGQMTAYVNYLKALDPAFKGLVMTARIFDGGSGPTAAISGAQLEPDSHIYWNAGTSGGALWPNSTFFSPTTIRPANNWVVIEMVVWTQGPGRGYSQNCEKRYIKYRPNVVNGRVMAGGTGFSVYSGPGPATAAQRPMSPQRR